MRKIVHYPENFNGIAVVGEAPGREENFHGKPFVGPEGQYLRSKCKLAGFNLDNCLITNTVHKKPFKNVYDSLTTTDLQLGKDELFSDLKKYKPNVVISLGAKSLEVLTGKQKIFEYRGAVLESTLIPGLKVMASVHPGNIFKGNSRYDIVLKNDLEKALYESFTPDIIYPERNIEVIRSINQAISLLHSLCDSSTPHAVDIEATGPALVAYGIATSKRDAYVIPKELCENPSVLKAIGEYAKSSTPKMFHNALFDVFHNAFYYGIWNRNIFYDTMIAEHAVFPTLPKSLAFCASFYTNEIYWKSEGKEIIDDLQKNKIVDWEAFYQYNAKDCCLTYEIYEKLEEEIDYWQVRDIFNLMMDLVPPALFSQMRGLKQDTENMNQFAEKNEKEVRILQRIIDQTVGEVNINSSPQMKKLIYEQWDMPKQYKWYGGKKHLTTSHDKLEVLERYPTPYKPLLGLIRRAKKTIKLRDFYNVKTDFDSRVRFAQKITGTYTGRWSTSKSITGSGFNIQNQPEIIRTFYEADDGKIFIEADLHNAEARIVAAVTGDEEWLAAFDKEDQHSRVAMELFNLSPEQVKDIKPGSGKTYRYTGKRIQHAAHYLLGWRLLSELLSCSAAEAKQHKANYHQMRPRLQMWHDWVSKELRKTRYIRTCFGRVIQFFGPNFDSMITDAVAAEPQSTSVDYLNMALSDFYYNIPEFEFCQQGHDSVLSQVDDNLDTLRKVIPEMKSYAEREITIMGIADDGTKTKPMTLRIPLEFKIGYYWGKMVEIKDDIKSAYEKL